MASTDPDHWFLDSSTMSPFRSPAYTSGNHVEALIDGKAYMDDLHDKMSTMAAGDYYYFSGWRAKHDMPLKQDVSGSDEYGQLITQALDGGADVGGILWFAISTAPHPAENQATVVHLGSSPQRGVLDNRVVIRASHHQKTAVISALGSSFAYIGGIDIAPDRWDTPDHANPSHRVAEGFEAWHDVHAIVEGAAVGQIYDNIRERWNDPNSPHRFPTIPGGSVPPSMPAGSIPPVSVGTHNVQVLRTLACKNTYSFLPGGEQTIRLAYEKVIDQAEHYIYIEDQYVWTCSLMARLAAAVARGVKVIFVVAHQYDIPVATAVRAHTWMRYQVFLDALRQVNASNVYVYHLQRLGGGADIYVHSKVMIIDDRVAFIGSCNINLRGHTSDSELHISVVDDDKITGLFDGSPATVCKFARELRRNLWAEHLGITIVPSTSTVIDDPITGLSQWPTASNQVHHALVHPTPPPGAGLPPGRWARRAVMLLASQMNLETRC